MLQHRIAQSITEILTATSERVTIAGSEATFISRGEEAFLLLHGWGASAESLRFLAAGVAAAGYSALSPTYPGHGTDIVDMMKTGPRDWLASAQDALGVLSGRYGRVYILGVSMGGCLALQLASLRPDLVAAVVTVNAPVFLGRPSYAKELLSGTLDGTLALAEGPSCVGEQVHEITYGQRSRKSGIDLITMSALSWEILPLVEAPLLIFQSVLDDQVCKESAEEILLFAGSNVKKIVWLNNSYHTSQLDIDRETIIACGVDFARSVASASNGAANTLSQA